MEWWRLVPAAGVFCGIEVIDHNVAAINIPWWLSVIMALFLTFADIIFILIVDYLFD